MREKNNRTARKHPQNTPKHESTPPNEGKHTQQNAREKKNPNKFSRLRAKINSPRLEINSFPSSTQGSTNTGDCRPGRGFLTAIQTHVPTALTNPTAPHVAPRIYGAIPPRQGRLYQRLTRVQNNGATTEREDQKNADGPPGQPRGNTPPLT